MKRTTYTGKSLREISFPLGGIGTGSVGLAGNGSLIDWEIRNTANKCSDNAHTHFAVKAEKDGQTVDARVLIADTDDRLLGPNAQLFGYGISRFSMQGFPHFRDCTFVGEYPVATVRFSESCFPGDVTLTAFNPLIPLQPDDSGLPAAFFTYQITNTSKEPLNYTVAGTVRNPTHLAFNRFRQETGMSALFMDNLTNADTVFDRFDMTLATDETENVYPEEAWYMTTGYDGVENFWRDFTRNKTLPPRSAPNPRDNEYCVLSVCKTAMPGETVSFRFLLSWNAPNRKNTWDPHTKTDENGNTVDIPMQNYYATRFSSSYETARYALTEWDRLYRETMRYHDALFSSTLPEEVLDAVSATTSVLKTETCLRIGEKGDFYGWEGLASDHGSCPGTCTHVWNYAYAMCYLFPTLERNIRENDYLYNQKESGAMVFRTRIPFGREPGTFRPCVDGQMGGVLKVYRDWKMSGDTEWLRSLWDHVKKSIAFAWSTENPDRWDRDRDGILEGRQHHTLDMELFGPSAWLEGFYLGALKAAAEMSDALSDTVFGNECRRLYANGRDYMTKHLYNGRYFIQKVNLRDSAVLADYADTSIYWHNEEQQLRFQIGDGCAVDQMLAQWHADISGLGPLYDAEQVDTALDSVMQYNYLPDMRSNDNPYRQFAVNGEAGVIECSYPDGTERPATPLPHARSSMHGFAYAFAGLLISRGHIRDGLRVVRSVRDCYRGDNRNPWNEMECGSNYARSMASFALLPIFSGMQADMTCGYLGFAPKIKPQSFCCLFSCGEGWGTVSFSRNTAKITVLGGQLRLSALSFAGFTKPVSVQVDGRVCPFSVYDGEIRFTEKQTVSASVVVQKGGMQNRRI